MSGSFDDRPPGHPRQPPPPSVPRTRRGSQDPYTDAWTQSGFPAREGGAPARQPAHVPAEPAGDPYGQAQDPRYWGDRGQAEAEFYESRTAVEPEPLPEPATRRGAPEDELRAEGASAARLEPKPAKDAIVPAGSVTGRSLTLVISIMCFLACLTAGAVYMVNQLASAWLKDMASEVTIQIEPKERADNDRTVKDVTAFIARQPGIRTVKPLSTEESASLLEPWLGSSDALKALPVPRLVAIEIDRASPPDLAALRERLAADFKGVSLDDHRQWQRQFRTVTHSFALGGIAILMLVGAATTAIIVSATRSAMASNREIVEVLHFVGATDRFISREFEKHFLRLGVRAGCVGAAFAMAVFLLLPSGMELLGGGTVTMAELRRLVGAGYLDPAGYAVLVVVVVVIALLCMFTSRFGVYKILNSQH